MTTSKKTCFKCNQEKDLDNFYRHKQMKDGRLNKCKECTRGDVRSHRRSDEYREKVLAYDRKRGSRQSKDYRDQHKANNPVHYLARSAVNNAVRDGRIVKPVRCQNCGHEKHLHGHHYDYTRPLSVIWLCVACHRQLHAFDDLVKKEREAWDMKNCEF